jgi:TonB family protein
MAALRSAIAVLLPALAGLLWLAPGSARLARHTGAGVAFADTVSGATPDTFLVYDEPPRPIKIYAPEYPSEAKRARMEGTVDVRMTISEHGRVIDAVVHRSDTIPALEEAALKAAKISLFRPALAGGRPVKARLVFPFPFKVQ